MPGDRPPPPEFDESHIAYQDLRFLLRMPDGERTGNGMGEVVSPIIIEGRTVGSWKHTVEKGRLVLTASLFTSPTPEQISAIEVAAERYGTYMNLPVALVPAGAALTETPG